MKPGPKPISTDELERRGSWRAKARKPDRKLTPDCALPTPPTWLSPEGKREFRRLAKMLFAEGALTSLDAGALGDLADLRCRYRALSKQLRDEGEVITVKGDKGQNIAKANPAATRADLVREKARIAAHLDAATLDEAKARIRAWSPKGR